MKKYKKLIILLSVSVSMAMLGVGIISQYYTIDQLDKARRGRRRFTLLISDHDE